MQLGLLLQKQYYNKSSILHSTLPIYSDSDKLTKYI